jgi:hypothetical protein
VAAGEQLPGLRAEDPLGRGVFSSKQARRWRNGTGDHQTFLEAANVPSLSVDRLNHAPGITMAKIGDRIANGRGVNFSFYGWAVVTVKNASQMERTVRATPLLDNPYHADIDVNLPEGSERRDMQKQHAVNLARNADWRERPATS